LEVDARGLAGRYEWGNVISFRYAVAAIPDNDAFEEDLRFMVGALGALYLAADKALQLPGDPAPEIADALTAAKELGSPRRKRPRYLLSHAERVAIEEHAVEMAMAALLNAGFSDIRNVGSKRTWDIEAHLGDVLVYVEVKGTTSNGSEVGLTANQVDWYGSMHPATMLIIVSGIDLDRAQEPPVASGGYLRRIYPWAVELTDLVPISYTYTVPTTP
jgi:hypothetical protein